tara:strand:- start:4392 stop:6116 length:1725 start_codon:yes stop_codon:yes gene_type:complete
MQIKKLILNFEKKNEYVTTSDSIILSAESSCEHYILNSQFYTSPNKYQQLNFSSEWGGVAKGFTDEWLEALIKSHESYVYRRIIKPILNWINTVDSIINSSPALSTIELNSCVLGNEVFLYEAEGEVNRKVFYQSDFYIPVILINSLKKKHPNLKFVIKEKKSKRYNKIFSYYLRNIAFFVLIFKTKISLAKNLTNISIDKELKKETIFLVRSLSQANYLEGVIKHLDSCFVFSSNQISQSNSISSVLKSKGIRHLAIDSLISKSKVIKIGLKTIFNFIKPMKEVSINIDNYLKIPTKYIVKDIIVRGLDYACYQESIALAFKRTHLSPRSLISCDPFSPHSYFLPRNMNFETKQLQVTLINPEIEANFIYTDKFLFHSKSLLDKVTTLNPELSEKLGYCPPFTSVLESKSELSCPKTVKNIVYFSQPIYEQEELLIINSLLSGCIERNIKFKIKPHPRQKIDNFSKLNCKLVDMTSSNSDTILESDIVITRNSSIGADCWAHNVPIIFIRHNDFMRSVESDYLPKGYIGDLNKVEDIFPLIESEEFYNEFYNVREYLNNHITTSDIFSALYEQ